MRTFLCDGCDERRLAAAELSWEVAEKVMKEFGMDVEEESRWHSSRSGELKHPIKLREQEQKGDRLKRY
jgi:hypothetical protein